MIRVFRANNTVRHMTKKRIRQISLIILALAILGTMAIWKNANSDVATRLNNLANLYRTQGA